MDYLARIRKVNLISFLALLLLAVNMAILFVIIHLPAVSKLSLVTAWHAKLVPGQVPGQVQFYGASIRSPDQRRITKASWFSPPVLGGDDKHAISVAMALVVKTKAELCPPGVHGWVWIEDDCSLCSGAQDHIDQIVSWMGDLDPEDPLVYVRTSFGFNGHIIRCARHDEFAEAVFSARGKPAIDDTVGKFLMGKVAVYRWNLFEHHSSPSTIQVDVKQTARRDRSTASCMDLNLNTLIYFENYDSRCAVNDSNMSPCPALIEAGQTWDAPAKRFPKVAQSLKFGETEPIPIIVGRGASTCNDVCAARNMTCSVDGLVQINAMFRAGVLPFDMDGNNLPCTRTTPTEWEGDDQPMVHDNICYSRLHNAPVCEGQGINRICACRG